ncbi:MAG: DUF503 family protein [Phycisphaerales bacterium]|nr:DUF503 family protein [Phycisphaerales bacterium]
MVIAVLQFELRIRGSESLKDKRRVVKSVKDRLHREHQVSVAEVGSLESLTSATMALAAVGSDGKHMGEVLDRISAKLRALPDAELAAVSRRILHASEIEATPDMSPEEEAAIARELLGHYHSGAGAVRGDP